MRPDAFRARLPFPPKLLIDLVLLVKSTIGRNGFRKIIIFNGHGGNESLLPLITQFCLAEDKPYQVYLPAFVHISDARRQKAKWGEQLTRWITRASGKPVSCSRQIRSSFALDRAPAKGGKPRGRLKHLPPTRTALGWYRGFSRSLCRRRVPGHAREGQGDPRRAGWHAR